MSRSSRAGAATGWGSRFVVQCGHRVQGIALGDHVARAVFAATALGGDTQLKLDFIKPHASAGMAGDVTVRNTAANTNNHGSGALDGRWLKVGLIINENSSH